MTRRQKAIAWLLGLGLSAASIVGILEGRGVDTQTARTEVRQVRESLRGKWSERVLVVVPLAQVAQANDDAARLICGPQPDGGDSDWQGCYDANVKSFDSERYCRISDGVEVARGMEVRLTPAMWARVRDERDPDINYTVRRGDFDKSAELAAAGLRRCIDEAP